MTDQAAADREAVRLAINAQMQHTQCHAELLGADLADAAISALAARGVSREAKDGAYKERDLLVCALSKLFPSCLGRHVGDPWDDDWRWIVFVSLPTGQASWHIHDSELALFEHLPRRDCVVWDGHSTDEKYARLAAMPPHSQAEIARLRAALDKVRDEVECNLLVELRDALCGAIGNINDAQRTAMRISDLAREALEGKA